MNSRDRISDRWYVIKAGQSIFHVRLDQIAFIRFGPTIDHDVEIIFRVSGSVHVDFDQGKQIIEELRRYESTRIEERIVLQQIQEHL